MHDWFSHSHRKARYRVIPSLRRTPPAQHSEFICRLITGQEQAPVFDVRRELYDASTKIRVYSSLCTIPDDSLFAFSSTLTTTTLDSSRLRWFEACFRQPMSEYAGVVQLRIPVCHESRVGLLATAIEIETGPPVAASGRNHQTAMNGNNKTVCRLDDLRRMS